MLTPSIENYLKAIYKIEQRNLPVQSSEVAQTLHVTAASVTNMLKKLADQGLVSYAPYQAISLTAKGRFQALRIIRNHRVLELYLSKVLGLTWDEVDQEAELLEHLVSDKLIEAMDEALDHPRFDPHGSPIPTAKGEVPVLPPALPMTEMKPGERGVISRIHSASDEMLRYLGKLNLYPNIEIEIIDRAPFGGPLMLRVGEDEHSIGPDLAKLIFVAVV